MARLIDAGGRRSRAVIVYSGAVFNPARRIADSTLVLDAKSNRAMNSWGSLLATIGAFSPGAMTLDRYAHALPAAEAQAIAVLDAVLAP